jgi:hypothetical protein
VNSLIYPTPSVSISSLRHNRKDASASTITDLIDAVEPIPNCTLTALAFVVSIVVVVESDAVSSVISVHVRVYASD